MIRSKKQKAPHPRPGDRLLYLQSEWRPGRTSSDPYKKNGEEWRREETAPAHPSYSETGKPQMNLVRDLDTIVCTAAAAAAAAQTKTSVHQARSSSRVYRHSFGKAVGPKFVLLRGTVVNRTKYCYSSSKNRKIGRFLSVP